MQEDIIHFIQSLLIEKYKVPPAEVSADATYEGMELDSLALMEILLSVEKKFGLKVPEDRVVYQQSIRQSVISMTNPIAA